MAQVIFFKPLATLFSLVCVLVSLHPGASLSWDGDNTLKDLEAITNYDFANEASYWTMSSCYNGNGCMNYSFCSGRPVLGGYQTLGGTTNQYYQRIYTGLPVHNQIDMMIIFYPIDSWDPTDYFQVEFDGQRYDAWWPNSNTSYRLNMVQYCGSLIFQDFAPIYALISVPHTASTLTFRVISQLDEPTDNESLGFRDINIQFLTTSNPSFSICGRVPNGAIPDKVCPCDVSEYMARPNSGMCYRCDSSCATCTGPKSTQCTSCSGDTILSRGGTCSSQICDSSCATCSGPLASDCLSCANSTYQYQNDSCLPTCPYPFVSEWQNGVAFCNTPCTPGSFLYENGTCLQSCGSGYVSRTEDNITYCEKNPQVQYPCHIGLNYDNLMATNCSNLDNACEPGFFQYQNGSCLLNCIDPYYGILRNGSAYCYSPSSFPDNNTSWPGDNSTNTNHTGNSTNNITCPTGTYLFGDLCLSCDAACATCNGPQDCLSCQAGYIWSNSLCLTTCPVGEYAAAPNYTSCSSCPSGCETCTDFFNCQSCSPGFILSNGTCNNGTTTPNNTDTNNSTYNNGCSGANFYKHQNGSCLATCPSPFVPSWFNNSAYCNSPCVQGSYISINNTCITSCEPGETPRIQGDIMFCDKNNSTNSTNSTDPNNNSPSVVLEIYIRYNISLVDFDSQDGLAKFVQQLAALLGVDPSYITIVSIREGSTIIESQISIASSSDQESMNTAMTLAETMGNQVSDAVANNGLNIINGVSILDYKKSIQVVKSPNSDNHIQVSDDPSSKGATIGLGTGLAVLGLVVFSYVIYRYRRNSKFRSMKTKIAKDTIKGEIYRAEANANQTNQEGKDESFARINNNYEREPEKPMSKSKELEEIDIHIEGSETNKKQMHQTIKQAKEVSISQASSSLEELDVNVEAQTDKKEEGAEQEKRKVDVHIVIQDGETENQNVQEQQDDKDEKPLSLHTLLGQDI